ncbi:MULTISPECIES: hypothetical protein [Atopobiaceae]|uniref:Type II secretion system protein n=1 Tax=Parafannyhessea umbonata TaxID=604330 RepID=A0A1H9Q1A1_9ACTN|nr:MULTISPECIES: hypothetical protein [Atopobiaceae]SEH48360.1 hypothetical protein SAMN05216447_103125 [Parafannyhessea umbonata]SER54231.1 hypothetical protein SAMN05216446_1248 [Parafannyhessea umbonata]SJZ67619.1 hypothetical protein SAMN06298223_1077 [Olsenella sp. KH1P3]
MTKRLSARLVGGGNTAFLVEALVLLMVLIATLAVFSTLFSSALVAGKHSARLNEAVLAASNEAESFSADPKVGQTSDTQGGLVVDSDVSAEPTSRGTLYHARITVREVDGSELFSMDTARYVGGERS